jgi:hypothetical protein
MMLARFFVLSFFCASAYAQVALVTDLSGKAGAFAILSEIHADTTVKLEGELTVLYYATGDEFRFRGPARIAFAAGGPKILEGAAPQTRATNTKKISVKPGGVTPATFVMRGAVSPELRARIEAARPAPNAPVSERVAFAAWLEQMQLKDEARSYWKALAAERPDSAQLKVLAGN